MGASPPVWLLSLQKNRIMTQRTRNHTGCVNGRRMNQDELVNIVSTVAMIVTLILGVLMTIAAIHATFFAD